GPRLGLPGQHPARAPARLATDPAEPQERPRNRQGAGDHDGAAAGNGGRGPACSRGETVEKADLTWVGWMPYRRLALILSNAVEPGHSSFSLSALSGFSTVLR